MSDKDIISQAIEMFGCDAARIAKPCGNWFLIVGWKRHTKDWNKETHGQWYKNGEPIEFEYLEEKTIAMGHDEVELMDSALRYKEMLEDKLR